MRQRWRTPQLTVRLSSSPIFLLQPVPCETEMREKEDIEEEGFDK
jgi:hypothetical protein